jgi:hypothetical protein
VNTTALTILRLCVTAVITGLTAAQAYYPHEYWLTAVIAAMAAIGVSVVPAIGQTMVTITPPTTLTQMHATGPFTGDTKS